MDDTRAYPPRISLTKVPVRNSIEDCPNLHVSRFVGTSSRQGVPVERWASASAPLRLGKLGGRQIGTLFTIPTGQVKPAGLHLMARLVGDTVSLHGAGGPWLAVAIAQKNQRRSKIRGIDQLIDHGPTDVPALDERGHCEEAVDEGGSPCHAADRPKRRDAAQSPPIRKSRRRAKNYGRSYGSEPGALILSSGYPD